jgi:alpha-beta hydrolase superfamily lysophospholipase
MHIEKRTIRSQGVDLATTITRPSDRRRHPVAMLLPGFFYKSTARHMATLAEDLANAGVVAVRFDYPGFGESGGTMNHYRFSRFLEAIDKVRDQITNLPYSNGPDVSLCGHSMGGILAVNHAVRRPDTVRDISIISSSVGVGTSSLFRRIRDEWQRKGSYPFPVGKDEPPIQVPYAFLEDAAPYDTLSAAEKVRHPLLVIVGSGDDVVDPKDTTTIYERAGSLEKKLEVVPGMGHNYAREPQHMATVNRLIVDFVTQLNSDK